MSSDAKIGLLLGLVFIFIIAFLINGLPNFRGDGNNNELTTNMVSLQNNPPGLAAKERKAREVFNQIEPAKKRPFEVQPSPRHNQSIRFETALPKKTLVLKEASKTIEVKRTSAPVLSRPVTTQKRKAKIVKPALPKIYVVSEGDNLTVIAKKFYGSENGNEEVNAARIFGANRRFLKSPDEIYVGQRLIIPPLSAPAPNKNVVSSVLANPILEKVKSIGKRHLSAEGRKALQKKQYVVREGDSLWRIAAEQLGDGSRYSEIAKLNTDILDDESSLPVGMRLKMPVR
ncbi:MAG: LysM peptidoglycan-binding domain-containing protein [Planctomycetota bacterium]|jgi:nucleoid-associated protein YgaU